MKESIFWPVLIAVFLAMRAASPNLEDSKAVANYCFGPKDCSIWSGAELIRRTFVISKDGTHVLVQMTSISFTGPKNKREFLSNDSEEVLSGCEIYDAENWTCHGATNTTIDWNISFRDGKFTTPASLLLAPKFGDGNLIFIDGTGISHYHGRKGKVL